MTQNYILGRAGNRPASFPSNSRMGMLAVLAAAASQLSFATAGQTTLLATGDTRLMRPGWFSGTSTELGVYQDRDRTLIQFDLSSLPAGVTITSATLGLYDGGYSHDGSQLQMFRVTKPWTEGTSASNGAVWTRYDGVNSWDNAGGDAVGTGGTQLTNPYSYTTAMTNNYPTSGTNTWTWDATALVTEWYAGTYANNGIMIKQQGTSSQAHFKSRESGAATTPFLVVQYTGDTDVTPPTITAGPVVTTPGRVKMKFTFSEDLLAATATNTSNFVFTDPSVQVVSAVLATNQRDVTLTINHLAPLASYDLTISGINDLSGNPMSARNFTGTIGDYIVNWALAGTASQSSTLGWLASAVASSAIDGNSDGNLWNGSVTHSDPAPGETRFWEVDMGALRPVQEIDVYFRNDGGFDRNAPFTMRVLDGSRNEVWSSTYTTTPTAPYAVSLFVPSGVNGRYVRFEPGTADATPFSLAEVMVLNRDRRELDINLKDWTGTSQSNRPAQATFLTTAGLEAAFVWADGDGAWERVTFDGNGATFGLGNTDYPGRNSIRTTYADYDEMSFDAYVTVSSLGTNFEAWLGLGSGAIVGWGEPTAPADHAVYLDLRSGEEPWDVGNINNRYSAIKVGPTAKTAEDHWGAYGATAEIRMKMSYDAVAKTATFSFDNNYDGVTFTPDRTLAPINTSDLFSGKAAKVFFGSRSGAVLKDFKITKSAAASNFGSWALTNSITGGPNDDSDNDGVTNLVEYALIDGGERGSFNAATKTVSFTKRAAPYGTDVTLSIEESDDLGITDPWQAVTPVIAGDTLSYTLPTGKEKVFTRLKVSQNP